MSIHFEQKLLRSLDGLGKTMQNQITTYLYKSQLEFPLRCLQSIQLYRQIQVCNFVLHWLEVDCCMIQSQFQFHFLYNYSTDPSLTTCHLQMKDILEKRGSNCFSRFNRLNYHLTKGCKQNSILFVEAYIETLAYLLYILCLFLYILCQTFGCYFFDLWFSIGLCKLFHGAVNCKLTFTTVNLLLQL